MLFNHVNGKCQVIGNAVATKSENESGDIQYFEKLGDSFDAFMSSYDVQRRLYLVFSILLGDIDIKGKKVLEIGCGTGSFSDVIVRKGAELTVVDIGQNLVHSVEEKTGCKGVVADACNTPFKNDTFDIVISSECIEHTTEPLKAIAEMCRVCDNEGFVCLTTPNKLWYPVLALSQKLGLRKFSGIENWIFPAQAKRVLANNGFGKLKMRGCHLWPFQIRFTRRLLSWIDCDFSFLYPVMINFGIVGQKKDGLK